ncbi:MAG: HAD-IA family hydrolase [Candidatus Diapherotrites archaeon]
MIEGIIFDVDGVLLDVTQSYRLAIRLAAEKLTGKKISNKEISKIKRIPGFNNDWDATYALIELIKNNRNTIPLTEKEKKSREYKKVVEEFQRIYEEKELIKKDKLLIGKELLKELQKKFVLGIVTGRPKKEALQAFELNKLQEFFSKKNMIALEDCEKEKPNPEPLLNALKKLKVNNAIYIGDTENDVIAAKKAGIKCIYVGKEKIGNYQIRNVNEIKEILDKEILNPFKVRKAVQKMNPYNPPTERRKGKLRLDFNENTLGLSPKVIQAVKNASGEDYCTYPEYNGLREKIAEFTGLKKENIVATNAGDEGIRNLMDCFLEEGEEIIYAIPSFAMFRFYAELRGAKITEILYNKDLSYPTKKC